MSGVDASRKYSEYKQKLEDWERLFEEDTGRKPTAADREHDETYGAIYGKAEHYRRLVGEKGRSHHGSGGGGGGRRHKHRHSSSSHHDEADEGDHRSLDDRLNGGSSNSHQRSSSGGHDDGYRRHRKHGKHGHRGSSGGSGGGSGGGSSSANDDSPPKSVGRDRRSSSQATATTATNDDFDSTHGGGALPALPHAVGTLSGNAEWAVALAQATEALSKCRKWERAFERQQGESPSAEVKAASSTYGGFERRYLVACNEMARMVAAETAKLSSFDDALGVRGAAIQTLASSGGGAAGSDTVIQNRRRSAVMANDESMSRMGVVMGGGGKPAAARPGISSEATAATDASAAGSSAFAAAPKAASVHGFLLEACKKVTLFSSLKEKEVKAVVASMVARPASKGEVVIRQGDHGDHCYVVESGTYNVFLASVGKGHQSVKTYEVRRAPAAATPAPCPRPRARAPCPFSLLTPLTALVPR